VKTCLSIQDALASQKGEEEVDRWYLWRRNQVNQISAEYDIHREDIPRIEYNEEERRIWKRVYKKLMGVQEQCAPEQIHKNFKHLAKEVGMGPNKMP
jgi:hypothetical protein